MQTPQPSIDDISRALQQGRLPLAEQWARQYLQVLPVDESALVLLGLSEQLQGKLEQAEQTFLKLTRLQPGSPIHWNNLGTVLRAAGQGEAAESAYRQSLVLDGKNVGALENLGLLYHDRGDFAAARFCFLGACELDPDLTSARIYGAHACCECTDMANAERLVASWWQWTQIDLDLQLLLASVMMRIGHPASAETILLSALQRTSDKARVQVRLLMHYERLNRTAEAQALLAQLPDPNAMTDTDLQNEIVNAYAAIASREKDFQKASALLEPLAKTTRPGSDFFFALAHVRDKLKDADGAMDALRLAHAGQMKKAVLLAPELTAPEVDPLTRGLEPVTADQYRQWLPMLSPTVADSPVFIVGFPRSGTTMLEQMLDAVPMLRAMDEQPFFQDVVEHMGRFGLSYPQDLHRLDAAQCEQLRNVYWSLVRKTVKLEPGQRLVDKNPLNMLRLPLINRLFPEAKIIFALRHPCDVVLSCYMQSFGAPAFMVLCSSLQRLARGYANAMQGWRRNVQILSPRIMELRHEDLLADFAGNARRIGAFIDVADTTPMLAFHEHARKKGYIATPSYAQVTEPANTRGLGRWLRYRAHLEPVLPILKPIVEHWGYAD
ncbi:MAG: sulfotransferase [Rudaea sp.]|nr:sulfotransferase [Rudaea sp.]